MDVVELGLGYRMLGDYMNLQSSLGYRIQADYMNLGSNDSIFFQLFDLPIESVCEREV